MHVHQQVAPRVRTLRAVAELDDLTTHADHFLTHGYALVPDVIPAAEIDAARPVLDRMYRPPTTTRDPADEGRAFRAEQFVGLREFPFGSLELDMIALHPALLGLVEALLGTTDIRLYQADLYAKFAGTTNFEQPLHCDYHNHAMLPPDPRFPQVQLFVYLCDVTEPLGPTHVVSRTRTVDRPIGAFGEGIDGRYDDLYDDEVAAIAPRGSVLAYKADTIHRGTDMDPDAGVRYTFNLGYKVAGADWVGANPWPRKGVMPGWQPLVEACSPRQLLALGFPPPGHAYWTPANLDGAADRYPGLDLSPWRVALDAT
jgi:hypothetical protein